MTKRYYDASTRFLYAADRLPAREGPAKATTILQGLLRPLVVTPVCSADGRTVTFYKAIGGVILGLYSEEAWPAVIASIAQLTTGRADMLLTLRDASNSRTATGAYTNAAEATLGRCLASSPELDSLSVRSVQTGSVGKPGAVRVRMRRRMASTRSRTTPMTMAKAIPRIALISG